MSYEYKEFGTERMEEVKSLFKEEGWMAYLRDDEALFRAFEKSLFCLGAFDNHKMVGFIRCVGDGEHIVLLQDLIVGKEYRQRGIGKNLYRMVSEKYKMVRMFQVNTDLEDEVDNKFYQSLGMVKLEKVNMVSYFRV